MSPIKSRKLNLFTLEDRLAPAAQLTATLDRADRVLRIEGTDQTDNIQLRHVDGRLSVDGITITVVDVDLVGTLDSVADDEVGAVDIRALDGDDVVAVGGLAPGVALTVNAGVGSDQTGFFETSIGRTVSFDGGGGFTDLRTGPNNYTLTEGVIGGAGLNVSYNGFGYVLLLSINGTTDTYNVEGVGAGTNLYLWGYAGNDIYQLGGPAGLDNIRGGVFASGMDGTESLTIDNTGGTGARFEVDSNRTTFANGGFVDYASGVESMAFVGGAGDETFAVAGLPTGVPVSMNGGDGTNTLEYVESTGLVAWYPGEGNAVDNAGEYPGRPSPGLEYGEGRIGQSSFYFDGVNDFVRVPNAAALNTSMVTVEAWVKSDQTGPNQYILAKGADYDRAASYGLYTGANGGLQFYIADATTVVQSGDAGSGVWDAEWHHVVGTYDGKAVRLFVDGVEVGTGSPTNIAIDYAMGSTQDLYIGNYGFTAGLSNTFAFRGLIDEPSIYDRALTAAQIQALYANGKAAPWAGGVYIDLPNSIATGFDGGLLNVQNVTGASGNDFMIGDNSNNVFVGRAGNDALYGQRGDDVLDGGAGSDFFSGGVGRNVYRFGTAGANESDSIYEPSALNVSTVDFSRLESDDPVSIELSTVDELATHRNRAVRYSPGSTASGTRDAIGGAGDDFIVGSTRGNKLYGGDGNDVLQGGIGKDTIDGQAGDDQIFGGDNNDLLGGGIGNDRLDGDKGDDDLLGDIGDDALNGGPDSDGLFGNEGNDVLQGNAGKDFYYGQEGDDRLIEVGDTADRLDGGEGNDVLSGPGRRHRDGRNGRLLHRRLRSESKLQSQRFSRLQRPASSRESNLRGQQQPQFRQRLALPRKI